MIDYKLGISIGSLAVVLIILGLNAQSLTTIPITPNLEERCPNDKYLDGYDSNGSVICQSFPFSLSNGTSREISHVLRGFKTAEPFYTTSFSYVDTGFPRNPQFTKQYDKSQLWMHLFIDFTNNEDGRSNFLSLGFADMDGNLVEYWNMHDGPAVANNLLAHDMMVISSPPAGDYQVVFRVAVNGGEGQFKTNIAALNIYEIPISSVPTYREILDEKTPTLDSTDNKLPNIESTLNPGCGDGVVSVDEQCDDGNNVSEDGCSNACIIEFCGDNIVQKGIVEQCDDGNNVNGDGCRIETECYEELAGTPCTDDGIFCNGPEVCNGIGSCVSTGDPCTQEGECSNVCNETADNCFVPAGTACGVSPDSCDGSGVCVYN